jgi:hypothetical protein
VSAEEPTDVARLRQAFAALRDDGTSEPVDSERIFEALHGDLSADERQAVVEQLLTSPAAAESWRLARELAPEPGADARVERTLDARRPAAWRWMSAAAAVLVAAGLGWQITQWRAGDEPVYRSVDPRAIASALPAGSEISRAQPVLRWTGIDGARYRVRVLDADLQLLEESPETSAREYALSPDSLARIPPAGQFLWQVEARIPGEVIVTSPTFMNRVP